MTYRLCLGMQMTQRITGGLSVRVRDRFEQEHRKSGIGLGLSSGSSSEAGASVRPAGGIVLPKKSNK